MIPRFPILVACCALGAFAGCRIGYDVAPQPSPTAGSAGAAGTSVAEGGAPAGGETGVDAGGGGTGGGTSGNGGTPENQGGSAQAQGGTTSEGGMAGVPSDGGDGTTNGGTTNGGAGTTAAAGGGGTTNGGAGASNGGAGATNGGAGATNGGAGVTAGTAGSGGTGGIVAGCSASGAYVICPTGALHDVAVANCASMGMQLIRVDSAAENDWLLATVPNSFIGASDAAVEGEWRWEDGTLFWLGDDTGAAQGGLYDNWAFKSPAGSPSGADCAKLNGTGAWVAVLCATTAPYTCETP